MSTTVLTLSWSTSRARDTYGYNIARLDDEATGKRYRCSGGGYDMVGTVFAEWLQETHQDALQAIAPRAYYIGTTVQRDGLYGMRFRPDGTVTLDGACGLESMRRIAEEVGLTVRSRVNKRGHVAGFTVEATARDLAALDASLGVGHVWTATQCPAYRTFVGAHCTCQVTR